MKKLFCWRNLSCYTQHSNTIGTMPANVKQKTLFAILKHLWYKAQPQMIYQNWLPLPVVQPVVDPFKHQNVTKKLFLYRLSNLFSLKVENLINSWNVMNII